MLKSEIPADVLEVLRKRVDGAPASLLEEAFGDPKPEYAMWVGADLVMLAIGPRDEIARLDQINAERGSPAPYIVSQGTDVTGRTGVGYISMSGGTFWLPQELAHRPSAEGKIEENPVHMIIPPACSMAFHRCRFAFGAGLVEHHFLYAAAPSEVPNPKMIVPSVLAKSDIAQNLETYLVSLFSHYIQRVVDAADA